MAFDMDSTLIQAEVIDELAKAAGSGEEVAKVTEAAMRGELDFKESLRRRVGTLAGLDESTLDEIGARLPLTDGVERLAATLKRLGYKLAIISGGFDFFGNILRDKLGFDYVFANRLEIIDGKLTGNVLGDIVDGVRKAEILRELAEKEGLALEQTIAVGDGANDLAMMHATGLAVGFDAKAPVRDEANVIIDVRDLSQVLPLLGLRG
ncbi:MAG TPA: phosphoserine phosphatase SerB [Terrimesophilobacter sp.]|nr:phosphoserine phosphatase SerB [Terrimesophilobacter sp.]